MFVTVTIILILIPTLCWILCKVMKILHIHKKKPLYVNYHITRQCNYQCGFCFHTAKTSHVLPINEAKRGLKLLADYGLKKINFAGGEPFMVQRGKYLGQLLKYCKDDLHIEICSVITNGSIVHKNPGWFRKFGAYVDIFAISCDSFNDDVNKKIGRYNPSKANQTEIVQNCADLCAAHNIPFKMNTVVNSYNWDESMVQQIQRLNVIRWKVFQCLLIEGENDGDDDGNGALRNAHHFLIDDEKFEYFINTHKNIKQLVAENNETMRNSYVLIDEYFRFLNNVNGRKEPSESILDVGVETALNGTFFDRDMFRKRDGNYQQTISITNKPKTFICGNKHLEW